MKTVNSQESIPTVYIFKDRKLVNQMQGYRDKSGTKAFIENALNS